MKRAFYWMSGLAMILLLSGLMISGCSESNPNSLAPAPGSTEPTIDPNDPRGGFTTSDEEPGFGDPELLAEAAEEIDAGDPMADDPEIEELEDDPITRIYALTILWGNLQEMERPAGNPGEMDGTDYDWSGTLWVSGGGLVLRNTVSFEFGLGDQVILPRPDRQTIEWISMTANGFDGLRVLVYQPGDDRAGLDDTLRFDCERFSREFLISELDGLDEIIDVDGEGNQIRFHSFLTEPWDQARGFLRGRWGPIAPGESVGHFHGVWVGGLGRVDGYLRGYYGFDDAGRRVFFGKYIDEHGRFQGILSGTWSSLGEEVGPLRGRRGAFDGHWVDENGSHGGDVLGRWRIVPGRPGYLDGRWWSVAPPPVTG